MPLYEYRCHRCGQTFEVRQRFADAPLAVHEGCGGEVERLLSPPVLQFKGTGWYVTDYAKKSHAPAASDSGSKESKESKKEEKPKTETTSKETKKAEKHK